jgi:cytochrome c biogenesis protein CcdA
MGSAHEGKETDGLRLAISLAVPTIIVIALLLLLVSIRSSLEEGMSNLATLLPVGYAFAAGMVASVNPCGALMLPSYIFFQLGTEGEQVPVVERLLKALRIAIVTAAGFTAIFGVVGVVVSAGGRWLTSFFPVAGLIIGLVMLGLGVWLLVSHRSLGILAASRVAVRPERTLWNMFLFGMAYAISSLSCTLPIFLVVIGSALGSAGLFVSLAQFLGYSLGMGAVLGVITVGTALFREVVERWLRRVLPYVHRLSALFLIGAGIYLIYYWVFDAGLFS